MKAPTVITTPKHQDLAASIIRPERTQAEAQARALAVLIAMGYSEADARRILHS